jgi:hypothetical protein
MKFFLIPMYEKRLLFNRCDWIPIIFLEIRVSVLKLIIHWKNSRLYLDGSCLVQDLPFMRCATKIAITSNRGASQGDREVGIASIHLFLSFTERPFKKRPFFFP